MACWAPKRPCTYPGCSTLTNGGRCDVHRGKDRRYPRWDDKRRPNAVERGYGTKWRQARAEYLEANKFCVECRRKGILAGAKVVDHIVPHKGNEQLFWDRKNWQALCRRCHDRKTNREDGGFGNRIRVSRRAIV